MFELILSLFAGLRGGFVGLMLSSGGGGHFPPPLTREEEAEYFRRARLEGDMEARGKLIEAWMPDLIRTEQYGGEPETL